MIVRFTKGHADKPDILACTRDDGTVTWTRERPGFVAHDLMHYAVETTLNEQFGFFGVIANGRNFNEFGRDSQTGDRYAKPGEERVPVEHVVNLLSQERAGTLRPDDFDDAIALACPEAAKFLTTERRDALRGRVHELINSWNALPIGAALTLEFPTPTDRPQPSLPPHEFSRPDN
ncbi:MAG: hypothetical protein WD271_08695 [Acidimicrobiia bacterium]